MPPLQINNINYQKGMSRMQVESERLLICTMQAFSLYWASYMYSREAEERV